jgi:RNA polymerase sigma factor for flagellar operon FliA
MTSAIRLDDRVVSYLPQVHALARRLSARSGGNVEMDELLGAGTVGLVDAATRFDSARGIPFDAFVHARVQGAMLDAMRAEDHVGRRTRQRERRANDAELKLRSKVADPDAEQVDRARGGAPRSLPRRLAFVPLDAANEIAADQRSPLEELESADALVRMRAALETLDERQRLILSLYYERELKYREIGMVLGVSESRVCQLLREIQSELRQTMQR